jgi:hypothetical protein
VTGVVAVANGGLNTSTAPTADQIPDSGASTSAYTPTSVPNCGAGSVLNYSTSTHTFSCTALISNPTTTYNASGTTTFAAANSFWAYSAVTPAASTVTTLAYTGLVAGGNYTLFINGAAGAGAITWTLAQSSGSCTASYMSNNGSGAFVTGALAAEHDELRISFDGTNCHTTLMPVQN